MNHFWSKALFFLLFGPAIVAVGIQVFARALVVVLPYLLLLAAVTGLVAGLIAGLVLRRRLPARGNGSLPPGLPLGSYRVRRPRGGVWR